MEALLLVIVAALTGILTPILDGFSGFAAGIASLFGG
jgi:hypothetical protein